MKIIVEAMCAEFGGIRTYVEHLLARWNDIFPDDELHVLVPRNSTLPTGVHARQELNVRRPVALGRPFAQTKGLRRAVRDLDPDVVLATLPSTTLLRTDRPMAVVVYDLRHELRPEQFSASRRFMRRISYGRGYRLADGFLSISCRSLEDLHHLHPGTMGKPARVAYLGADHVRDWPVGGAVGPSVTFAHHSNKNPDLVIDAWSALARRGVPVPPLLMLGVSGEPRERLSALIESRGLAAHVRLAPFLPDLRFQQVMAEAEMIVFPTDFEGFGLPVAEGMQLGKAVVIGPERATTEVADGHAFVMADWTADALADSVLLARAMTDEHRQNARLRGAEFTWEATVRETRSMLARICDRKA